MATNGIQFYAIANLDKTYIGTLSIIVLLDLRQWLSSPDSVLTLNMNILLPLFWNTWSLARGVFNPHAPDWSMNSVLLNFFSFFRRSLIWFLSLDVSYGRCFSSCANFVSNTFLNLLRACSLQVDHFLPRKSFACKNLTRCSKVKVQCLDLCERMRLVDNLMERLWHSHSAALYLAGQLVTPWLRLAEPVSTKAILLTCWLVVSLNTFKI